MNEILQFIGTFASIFSIPLAIIFYFKTSDARQNKIRLDIIRALSCRIGEGKSLDRIEVSAVLGSKIREHNIRKPLFTEVTILEDIIADVVSSPYLASDDKTTIVNDLGQIIEKYKFGEKKFSPKDEKEPSVEYRLHKPTISEAQRKRKTITNTFTAIAGTLSAILSIIVFLFGNNLPELIKGISFPVEVLSSITVSILAALVTFAIQIVVGKIFKK